MEQPPRSPHIRIPHAPAGPARGQPAPLLIILYQFSNRFTTQARWIASYPPQSFASAGFAVLLMNAPYELGWRRGDFKGAALSEAYNPLASIERAVEMLVEEGIADPGRVGIMGWSYGAWLVEFAISHNGLFKAASAGEGGLYNAGQYWVTGSAVMRYYLDSFFGGLPIGEMKHRERVEAALNHQQPDRCPMQISFTPEFADRLRAEMAMSDRELNISRAGHNPHGGGNTYELERALGEDLLLTSVGWANSYYQAGDTYTDEWGVTWKSVPYETPFGVGHYTEMIGHPLEDDNAVSRYQPPDPRRAQLYEDARRTIEQFKDEYWIVGVTVTTIWETAWALRGYDRMLTDVVADPDLAETILDIPYRYHLAAAKRLVEMGVDMVWIGDDVGAQHSMLISPAHWRRFLKPRMASFIGTLKAVNPQLKVAYHSDGMILHIIPELIEVGVDVLNPIQPACMDPAELKRLYGDRLCFWGTVDEQVTLPFGTPEEVRNEVRARLETVGKDGGLIIGPTHHVQLDTPMENFRAMVEAILG